MTAPAVQRLEGAILLQGLAVYDAVHLVGLGLRYRSRVDGIPPLARHRELLAQLTAASASPQQRSETAKVSQPPSPAVCVSECVDAAEAARALGVSVQFVRRIGPELGGWRVKGAWRFDRSAIITEAARREEATRG